ncbi:MAG TPA: transaldolase family protein [Anaerolineae bacterium]|nr:transaldolase family protein [Anaerolineae bacterium]
MPNDTGPLHEMVMTTPTRYWNDSCSVQELNYAIARGATGATSNPVIVLNVLKKEMNLWQDRIRQVIADNPTWSETQVGWQIYQELAVNGAKLLFPVFERENCTSGRLSIQTDPALYRNGAAILEQAEYFSTLAPNMQVKVPATSAGIGMVEEATYRGVNLNITVSFTVPQTIAAAEAIERGLERRDREGKDNRTMSPVVTMMVGRNDDWMKVLAKRDGIDIKPEYLEWCGVACFKKAYGIYKARGYRARLLAAAYRNFYHWTEFVGGDVTLTIPWEWQVKFNESNVKPMLRMQEPVNEEILETLYTKIPDFRRAYDEDGLTVQDFDTFGATVRTLRSFIEGWHNFVAVIRDYMLPNPDL